MPFKLIKSRNQFYIEEFTLWFQNRKLKPHSTCQLLANFKPVCCHFLKYPKTYNTHYTFIIDLTIDRFVSMLLWYYTI